MIHPFRAALDAAIEAQALPWQTSIELLAIGPTRGHDAAEPVEAVVLRCPGIGQMLAWTRPPPSEDAEAIIARLIPRRPVESAQRAQAAERAGKWEQAAEHWRGCAWAHGWWSTRPGEDEGLHRQRKAQAVKQAERCARAASRAQKR